MNTANHEYENGWENAVSNENPNKHKKSLMKLILFDLDWIKI